MAEIPAWSPAVRKVRLQHRTREARLLISAGVDSPDLLDDVLIWLRAGGFSAVTVEIAPDPSMTRLEAG